MLTTMRRHGIRLALFAILATALTAIVHQLTTRTIAHQAALQQQRLFDQVIAPDGYDNDLQRSCLLLRDPRLGDSSEHRLYLAQRQGQPIAALVETTAPDGYAGAIRLLVGADFSGKVLGVRVQEQHETPGLGDKIEIRISDWIDSFRNKVVHGAQDPAFRVKKDGGEFDQFTGATITPRAVVNAVRRTTLAIRDIRPHLASLPRCGESK
ncbi:electron transport complex subunit RsxG [Edwardsiella ictaluri]|uniref:electron transport complex subunit RsxG n=1 Tax=Edwardsiella ictaluri TaxID=67780 RepID=UPI0039F6BF7D